LNIDFKMLCGGGNRHGVEKLLHDTGDIQKG
jgi:hypothetical protein